MIQISQRTKSLQASPTLVLAAKARELAQQGLDVISLTVGEPDWNTPDHIVEAAFSAIRAGQTKYSSAQGIPELRKAIAKQVSEDMGLSFTPAEVTVSSGGKFVLYAIFQTLLNAGDEVLIPVPYWVSYPVMVELADGKSVYVATQAENKFKMTPMELEKAITPRTRALLLNSPSNPTGEIYSREELEGLAKVLRQHPQVTIVSDDIYNRLVFDGATLAPHILHVAPDLKDRTILVNGLSKTYAMTGWRLGWALGPKNFIDPMSNYQSQSVSCAATFTQIAGVAAIEKSDAVIKQTVVELENRRNFAHEALSKIPGIKVSKPGGAFYLWADIRQALGKTDAKGNKIQTCQDFSKRLLEDKIVAVVPGGEFGMNGFLRVSYTVPNERFAVAATRIREFIAGLS